MSDHKLAVSNTAAVCLLFKFVKDRSASLISCVQKEDDYNDECT